MNEKNGKLIKGINKIILIIIIIIVIVRNKAIKWLMFNLLLSL